MATNITDIFGTEITVSAAQGQSERSFSSYPGAHGVTSMYMGRRGWRLVIRGRIRSPITNYNAARTYIQNLINTIETWDGAAEQDLTYRGWTYRNAIMLPLPRGFRLAPGPDGKEIRWTADGGCIADFVSEWMVLA